MIVPAGALRNCWGAISLRPSKPNLKLCEPLFQLRLSTSWYVLKIVYCGASSCGPISSEPSSSTVMFGKISSPG